MIASEAGFPYTNGPPTESRFMRKLPKNKLEDDELGVFGAEKYFKGVIDEERLKTSNMNRIHHHPIQPQEKEEETYPLPKPKTPSSVRSESSWNSRKGLLVSNGSNHSKKTSVKSLLANLCCNCSDKGSIKVTEVKEQVKSGDLCQNTKPVNLSTRWADQKDVDIKREECFTFPVINPSEDIILESSRNRGQNDTGSDASSDLFEIESFSTNENNSFLKQQVTENNNLYLAHQVTDYNGYAPSEVSVDWSVVTASMADNLSTPEDLVVSRNFVKGSGILSGCKSIKAVRISSDEHGKIGGEKVAVIVSPANSEWCHRLDSATLVVLAKIQAGTKLKGAGSDSHRSQNRFEFTQRVHAANKVYTGCLD